jgi:hypothetical protein
VQPNKTKTLIEKKPNEDIANLILPSTAITILESFSSMSKEEVSLGATNRITCTCTMPMIRPVEKYPNVVQVIEVEFN